MPSIYVTDSTSDRKKAFEQLARIEALLMPLLDNAGYGQFRERGGMGHRHYVDSGRYRLIWGWTENSQDRETPKAMHVALLVFRGTLRSQLLDSDKGKLLPGFHMEYGIAPGDYGPWGYDITCRTTALPDGVTRLIDEDADHLSDEKAFAVVEAMVKAVAHRIN
jgi:hypothetical protein